MTSYTDFTSLNIEGLKKSVIEYLKYEKWDSLYNLKLVKTNKDILQTPFYDFSLVIEIIDKHNLTTLYSIEGCTNSEEIELISINECKRVTKKIIKYKEDKSHLRRT